MKVFCTFMLLLALGAGCKPKIISGAELENKLKETMADHLHKTLQPGTEITIKDVTYYPEKLQKMYVCRFKVRMHLGAHDTTGVVAANITNDFKEVTRIQ